ncbi:hypothetical protein WK29_16145 [Burkholderia vietnamiensis]|nr:hypothetical protein WK29_16145 [Burkholderia vietnamiensis]
MFVPIGLQVIPKLVGEYVFRVDLFFRFQDGTQLDGARFWPCRLIGPFKPHILTKTYDINPLTMLRRPSLAIDDFPTDVVAKFLFQHMLNDTEGMSLVVGNEVLHVLQHEGCRTFFLQNFSNTEK